MLYLNTPRGCICTCAVLGDTTVCREHAPDLEAHWVSGAPSRGASSLLSPPGDRHVTPHLS